MNGGGGGAPPSNGGEYLLHLLRNNNTTSHQSHTPQQTFPHDPAIAAVGPSIRPTYLPPNMDFGYGNWHPSSSPPIAPNNGGYFQQNPSSNPHLNPNFGAQQFDRQPVRSSKFATSEQDLVFGSVNRDLVKNSGLNGIQVDLATLAGRGSGSGSERGREVQNGNYRMGQTPPPGFSSRVSSSSGVGNERVVERSVDKGKSNLVDRQSNKMSGNAGNGRVVERNVNKGKANFVDHQRYRADSSIGVMTQNNLHSVPVCEVKESVHVVRVGDDENGRDLRDGDLEDSLEQAVESLVLDDESGDKNDKKKHHRDKDYRSDKRGQWIMGQRMRNQKSYTSCRNDINRLNSPFLALFESLIPAEEEKIKQEQLLTVLKKLVSNEWPEARLYLYGSCGNSFCFSKSDIDICLAMELGSVEKSEVLLKLAEIFMSDNLQNVQALTRARVPIVKLMDPVTGICCDICINNLLAVVNTKLLRDYSKIDVRLRQLVFLVKHWAKSRGVNETYHGTLSSYAYVLMCIHFLQQRRPAILPCLQAMEFTYHATVDNVEYGFFDKVEKLCNFGSQNQESIAQLVWGFFHYWAYCHDYANDVISVRTGHTISKRAKDWTRRVGNDRHLICIEDPFELSHDLGRVVDKFSIRVLREEFERAAHIMQYDPNPCVTLFKPYNPE